MHIYIKRGGEQSGPFTVAKIVAKLRDDSICISDLAWHEGAEGWKEISKCDYITRELAPEPRPSRPQCLRNQQSKLKRRTQFRLNPNEQANPRRASFFLGALFWR